MYTDGQTVNVPAVITESKVYLLNVLHTSNKLVLSSLLNADRPYGASRLVPANPCCDLAQAYQTIITIS